LCAVIYKHLELEGKEMSMRYLVRPFTACLLAVLLAVFVAGVASAQAQRSIVGPGESIQKAVKAAEPGDTILVRGVHRETVVVRKDGITLVGDEAVLVPPDRQTSPCGPAGFCLLGEVNFQTGEVSEYVEDVSITGFTVRNFSLFGIVAFGARDAKFVKNRAFNNGEYGITSFFSTGTKVISNVASGADDAAIYVGDSPHANTRIANNDTYDSASGILVRNSLHGQIIANKAHNNCVGIIFIADAPGPAGEFEVDGNTVQHNNRACPATAETPRLSGVGIGLLGARSVEIRANHVFKNVPSGPPALSGGVVLVRGIEGTAPKNNSVVGNVILRNHPDIFWDRSGSGNRFVGNECRTSRPGGLCEP
jgi:parallel beta-helix repeat protein